MAPPRALSARGYLSETWCRVLMWLRLEDMLEFVWLLEVWWILIVIFGVGSVSGYFVVVVVVWKKKNMQL